MDDCLDSAHRLGHRGRVFDPAGNHGELGVGDRPHRPQLGIQHADLVSAGEQVRNQPLPDTPVSPGHQNAHSDSLTARRLETQSSGC